MNNGTLIDFLKWDIEKKIETLLDWSSTSTQIQIQFIKRFSKKHPMFDLLIIL